jgi:hypothetical protein
MRAGLVVLIHNLLPSGPPPVLGVIEAAGLLFFPFAGYARIATLGEEVRDPARTIPRAIPLALGIALVVYAAVGERSRPVRFTPRQLPEGCGGCAGLCGGRGKEAVVVGCPQLR